MAYTPLEFNRNPIFSKVRGLSVIKNSWEINANAYNEIYKELKRSL